MEEDEDDLPLSEWVRRIGSVNFAACNLDVFPRVEDDILTTETLTAEGIVMEVKNQLNSAAHEKNLQEEEEKDSEEQEMSTINEAFQAIKVVHNFYEATSENVQLICGSERVERDLQMQYFTTSKQTEITDFCNACQ